MTKILDGMDGVRDAIGESLGHSDWLEITQERVDLFADATGDHQWIHVDVERGATSEFGGTIAHGFLTLSLMPTLLPQVVVISGFSAALNYGLNRLRFPSPVRVGSRIRLAVVLAAAEAVEGGMQVTYSLTFEIEGQEKPACVAEVLIRQLL